MLTWPLVNWFCSIQDQKSHSQWEVRFFVPALRAESVQQGWHELAQRKYKKEEDEEGRPPSQFKSAHHTFNIVVPITWKGAPSVPSDFKERWAHASESSRVWCEESWWDLSLLFSPNKCPFPFPQHSLFLRKANPPGSFPWLRKWARSHHN